MIIIDNTLISDEIYTECFACDIPKCKGACCVEGDWGAPLTSDEIEILKETYSLFKCFMRPEGIKAVSVHGLFCKDDEGELTTPLIDKNECAYMFFDSKKTAKCAIETAYNKGLIKFQKPISCHLYPIRITEYSNYDAVNYHNWHICDCAVKKGKANNKKIYEFLKEPLIRKYGESWYNKLSEYIESTITE